VSAPAPWSVFGGARYEHDLQPPFRGRVVALSCRCGWLTDWHRVQSEHLAADQLAAHQCRGHKCDDQCGGFCRCGEAICEHGYEIGNWTPHKCASR
jgi:hypothetical protein